MMTFQTSSKEYKKTAQNQRELERRKTAYAKSQSRWFIYSTLKSYQFGILDFLLPPLRSLLPRVVR
jgi:hypothetical protein